MSKDLKKKLSLSRKSNDPHKRLINNKSAINKKDTCPNTGKTTRRDDSFKNEWKINKDLLDDKEFRKSHMKKKEKLEIKEKVKENENFILKTFKFDNEDGEKGDEDFEKAFNVFIRRNFKEEFSLLFNILEEINLEQYLDCLIENDIDDIKKLLNLNEESIKKINIPLGHQLKLLKKIKQLNDIENNENDEVIAEQRENALTNKEEGSIRNNIAISTNMNDFNNDNKKFLYDFGEKEFNFQGNSNSSNSELYNLLNKEDIYLKKEEKNDFESINLKKSNAESCWNCYLLQDKQLMINFKDKYFCKELCLEKHKTEIQSTCKICGNILDKNTSIYKNFNWICSSKCLNQFDKERKNNLENIGNLKEPKAKKNEDNDEDNNDSYDPMNDF